MQKKVANINERTLPVLPVIQVGRAEDIVPIAEALAEGGIHALEITLRTAAGLEAIKLAKREFPDAIICAGTVISAEQMQQVADAGAEFIVTPGITEPLLTAAQLLEVDLLPGIATPSELMLGLDAGLQYFKLFPAAVVGGLSMLKAMYGPFPDVKLCPTGGLNADNFLDYLQLPNVFCIGGSWMIKKNQGELDRAASSAAASHIAQLLSKREL